MKKKYLIPEVEVDFVVLERSFLDSTQSSAPNLIYDDEIDPWSD